jgi:hypothetical protein
VADDPERTADTPAAGEAQVDEAAGLRARIATLEVELNKMRSEVARLNRDHHGERRTTRGEVRDRADTIREITERVDGERRRFFRAMVHSQMEQMRLAADLMSSFATRIERDNPADDPNVERDLPNDLLDTWLDTVDRALDIPEKAIETFEETYKQAPRTRREARAEHSV